MHVRHSFYSFLHLFQADYVVPVEDEDENYIHPTENSSLPSEKGKSL